MDQPKWARTFLFLLLIIVFFRIILCGWFFYLFYHSIFDMLGIEPVDRDTN
jgi:hypothetical protein